MLAGADANLAFPFRVGELFVGDLVLLDAFLRRVDNARPHRNAVPVAFGVAVLRRALAWSRDRGARRAITEVPEGARHLGAALRQAGFEPAEARVTWARAVDGADAP